MCDDVEPGAIGERLRVATHFSCFWCRGLFWKGQRTKEHIIPRALGGNNHKRDNIKYACSACNNERGHILAHHDFFRLIWREFKRSETWTAADARKFVRTHNKAMRKLQKVCDFLDRWKELERERLGYSPHETITYSIPTPEEVEACLLAFEQRWRTTMRYANLERLGVAIHERDGIRYIHWDDLKKVLTEKQLERFNKLFGIQTCFVDGPYAHDVEAVLERMFTGKLTGTQRDWD